jgi:hypothetical protein
MRCRLGRNDRTEGNAMSNPTKSLVPTSPPSASPTPLPTLPLSGVALVVIPPEPSPPTLEERAIQIRLAHNDVAAAILTAVERALDAGLQLIAAKEDAGHGRFELYVTHCNLQMRTAQNYMRLARQETQLRELIAAKANGVSYLTMPEALRAVTKLEAKKKPKRKKPRKMLAIFGRR